MSEYRDTVRFIIANIRNANGYPQKEKTVKYLTKTVGYLFKMRMNIKRYKPNEDKNGDFVLFEDVQKLILEIIDADIKNYHEYGKLFIPVKIRRKMKDFIELRPKDNNEEE